MLTRLVRAQLVIFTTASVIGLFTMAYVYLQVPTWLGIGHYSVTVDLPATGGLYRFANVTYRGVEVGTVSSVTPTRTGATAVLKLQSSPRIPLNVQANVRSVSAVGEQYVDLVPRGGGAPFLEDGSTIERTNTTIPKRVGPILDQLSDLLESVPKDRITDLLDESFEAFNGAGFDVGSLIDSGARITADANATAEPTRRLIEDSGPLLDAQARSIDSLKVWAHALSKVTAQVVDHDADFRTILATGPETAHEAAQLLEQLRPTLPVLLANLTSVGEVGVTYNPSLRQLLVLLPPYVAGFGSTSQLNNSTGNALGAFSIMIADPPACTVGFLPPSSWRSPNDLEVIDTPDDLYCKLPQDSPIAVRGVRNSPCMGKPGKRAPTVEICNSDRPYEPLAMRQHVLGPYPFDPNLVSQGIPPDSRVTYDENIFVPPEGTPLPPEGAPPPPEGAPAPPTGTPAPAPEAIPQAVPSEYSGDARTGHPPVAVASYDPRTGRYVAADGNVYQQTDLTAAPPVSWQDMLPH